MSDFPHLILKEHNDIRAKHHSPPLSLSPELCDIAQRYSEKLKQINKLEHCEGLKYGENLFSAMSQPPMPEDVLAKRAVQSWYNEMNDYKFGTEPKDARAGHFTQMIWKSTTELGVGYTVNEKGKNFVVCNYNPPGNFIGKYKDNVLKA